MPWTASDKRWQSLNAYEKAAAMALMEADRKDPIAGMHALDAMINRSGKEGVDLGEHVSQPIYQPTIEPAQQARLDSILKDPSFPLLTQRAEDRVTGREPDFVNGATHFLAPESTMLSLERQNPSKYRNWGPRGANWTGFDPNTGAYKNVVKRDASHAFLTPDGSGSGALPPPTTQPGGAYAPIQTAQAAPAAPRGAFVAPPTPGIFNDASKKSLGGTVGSALGAFAQGGSNDSERLAAMAKSGREANASMLNEDDQRQMAALKAVLARRTTGLGTA
jgi:hypothetical protein